MIFVSLLFLMLLLLLILVARDDDDTKKTKPSYSSFFIPRFFLKAEIFSRKFFHSFSQTKQHNRIIFTRRVIDIHYFNTR